MTLRWSWYATLAAVTALVAGDIGSAVAKPKPKPKLTALEQLLPALSSGKLWGYVDRKGQWAIEPLFLTARPFTAKVAAVELEDGTWGLIDGQGKPLLMGLSIEPNLKHGAAIESRALHATMINSQGKVILDRVDAIGHGWCDDGTVFFRQTKPERAGWIRADGKVVTKVASGITDATCFHEGLAAAMTKQLWGYINKKGKWVIQPGVGAGQAGDFSEGIAAFGKRYIDTKGMPVLERMTTGSQKLSGFRGGMALVETYTSYNLIDRTGKIMDPTGQYWQFGNGLHRLDAGNYRYLRPDGSKVDELESYRLDEWSGSIVRARRLTRIGLWDPKRGWIVPAEKYTNLGPLIEGRATFQLADAKDAGWGYLDVSAKVVIKNTFAAARDFSDGLAAVSDLPDRSSWYFIDLSGKRVIADVYSEAQSFVRGAAYVTMADGTTGYIDRNGRWIWKSLLPAQQKELQAIAELTKTGNDTDARPRLQALVDAGNVDAMYQLVDVLIRVNDQPAAGKWLTEAARRGLIEARHRYAIATINDTKKTDGLPIKWLTQAADAEYAPAQRDLGQLKAEGLFGVKREWWEGRQLLEAAAKTDLESMLLVGIGKVEGKWGYEESDRKDGGDLIAKAAHAGYTLAYEVLGQLYEAGYESTAADDRKPKAREWYQKAIKAGHTTAKAKLDALSAPPRS